MWFGGKRVVKKPIIQDVIGLEDVQNTGKLLKYLNSHFLCYILFGDDFFIFYIHEHLYLHE